ncbi:hypothetical protein ACFQ51_54480 [Streptomyces kaempferi]
MRARLLRVRRRPEGHVTHAPLQRDWARTETYAAVGDVVKEHASAYGLGLVYAQAIIGAHAVG